MRVIQYFKGKEEHLLALLLFLVGCIAGVLLFLGDSNSLLYFGDAASHIVRARQFIDSQEPGILNIGTVWLPLPHVMLLPFAAIDKFFYTGIAGAFLGIPFLMCTGLLLFSIIHGLTGSRVIAFLGAAAFGLNPNVVYMALTPMNEISLLFFVTLGGFALLRWLQTNDNRWILLCAGAVMLATLCRYEAWILAPFISFIATAKDISAWRKGEKKSAVTMSVASVLCWIGIALWFGWNYYEYGDALKFAHWTYSVGTNTVRDAFYHRPQDVFLILGKALLIIFGPVIILAMMFALYHFRSVLTEKRNVLLLSFFILPALFVVVAILIGFVQIDRWWWNWRYVITFGLFLSAAGSIGLSIFFSAVRSTFLRTTVVLCFVATPIVQLAVPQIGVVIFNDAKKSFDDQTKAAIECGKLVRSSYDGGSVGLLTRYGLGQRIMLSSRLPLKSFTVIYASAEKPDTISERYLVVGKDRMPETEEFIAFWISHKEALLQEYTIRSETDHFILMERKHNP